MRTYFRLLSYVRPHLGVFALAVLYMLGSTLLNGVQTGAFIPIIDRLGTNQPVPVPVWLPGWLAGIANWFNQTDRGALLTVFAITIPALFALKALFEFLQTFYMNDASQRIVRDLRQQLFTKFTGLSLDYHHAHPTGQTMSRILYDTGIVQNSVVEGLTDLVFQSLHVVMYLVFVFVINWKLSLITFVTVPIIGFFVVRIGKMLKKYSQEAQVTMGHLTSAILEAISGIQVVQGFLRESAVRIKFAATNEKFYRINRKTQKRMNFLTPTTDVINAAGASVIFWVGGREVLAGTMSLGTFGAFFFAMMSLARPFKRLARLHTINQQAIAAATRVFEVLDEEATIQEKPKARELPAFHREMTFDNVSFQYENQPVLRDVSLTIRAGETVAVVGPSGAGKSTMANLLLRFYDPTKGRVLIDAVDLRHVTLASLRQQIGLVTQETFLFNDTVRANLEVGRESATMTELIDAAKAANAHQFIARLGKGYDTFIGERGVLLSGGERQRLALARALVKNPPILVLDEATSHLDAESEHLITEALARLCHSRTVLVIAHRLSTVRLASRIIVVQEGRIVEQGSHDELLKTSALYRRFCELQLLDTGVQSS